MKLFLAFFTKALQKHYKALRTDGPTDRRTDGRTDTRSYSDARTHLKTRKKSEENAKEKEIYYKLNGCHVVCLFFYVAEINLARGRGPWAPAVSGEKW